MMKKISSLAIVIVAFFALVSCKKSEKILVKNDGAWNVVQSDYAIYADDEVRFESFTAEGSLILQFRRYGPK